MRDEDAIETTCCNLAERADWFCRKVQWPGRRGAADRFFAKDGRVLFVEFKDPDGELHALQTREIDRMHKAGVEVYVIDNVFAFKRLMGL